ncbi:polypeptide N-acetylgalactosaminyltransferase 5-like isoform X1 [Sinocyclocheilus grahami]|uniref:polypeptide N-acetylgalactosaminyltransferase 5-like isoform X1 n=1 Tax=Sinocyclocheilus grahami TaxID=75366 RepID=UPI0007AD5756|nr:PREDICTED: polypeptide N-acetylgalactosaminyltransferase 5-like isoform X1 [Sinocyclocheilus grahami]
MRFRKYLRGSGRVLAFVFIASVIWLLFDIAALRISIDEANQDLKEREIVLKQGRRKDNVEDVLKHPLQKVNIDKRDFLQNSNRFERKVDQVYRKWPKARPENQSKVNLNVNGTIISIPEKINETKAVIYGKVSNITANMNKIKAAVSGQTEANLHVKAHLLTKALPAVQEKAHPSVLKEKSVKKVHHINDTLAMSQNEVRVDVGLQKNLSNELLKPAERDKPKNILDHAVKHVSAINKTKPDIIQKLSELKDPAEEALQVLHSTSVQVRRSGGHHKVMALDVTDRPRDPSAVGQFGQPASVPRDKELESRRRWSEGFFNVFLSEQIPIDRAIPDTRPRICSENLVHDDLPSTSVIFCFVDEVWSTLLRSVHSVLNRSPPHLLKEIILVDDCSTKDYLKEQLDVYMSQFPKVRIIRLKERQGLIRARIAGASAATGEVLTFLDSHVECNVGWLEPLLERIYLDRKKVVCPVIEVISDKDMSYMLVDNFQRGIFRWPLVFGWSALPQEYIRKNQVKDSDPIRCPVMAGGLFSMDKSYFYELGAYDPGLDVWGGENMEISFKIWMCGGEIEIIPCSRVGHIFRGDNPYKFPKNRVKTVERNLARVAEVWLDDYKELFYGHGYHHLLDKSVTEIGNLTEQIELRKKLECKSFKWYLENVYPDLDAPLVKAEGLIFNVGTRKCLVFLNDVLLFDKCEHTNKSQHFSYTWLRMLRQNTSCFAPQEKQIIMEPCDSTKPHLRWMHKSKGLTEHVMIEGHSRPICLEAGVKTNSILLTDCDPVNNFQKWQFTHYYAE